MPGNDIAYQIVKGQLLKTVNVRPWVVPINAEAKAKAEVVSSIAVVGVVAFKSCKSMTMLLAGIYNFKGLRAFRRMNMS